MSSYLLLTWTLSECGCAADVYTEFTLRRIPLQGQVSPLIAVRFMVRPSIAARCSILQ